jgi:diacylglycerol kinase family enzyme
VVARAGTGNVFGKEVHVPRRLERALKVLKEGKASRFDLGYAEGDGVLINAGPGGALTPKRRYFLLMAGIGFDATVVRRVPTRPKRLLGTTSYVIWGAAEALRYRQRPARISLDSREASVDLFWMLLGNTRSYGGVADVALSAAADDGLLDAYVFAGSGLRWLAGMGARIALKRHPSAPGVTFATVRRASVETAGLDVQADGEYFGETPMRFGVDPLALPVLLMPGAADRILTRHSQPAQAIERGVTAPPSSA